MTGTVDTIGFPEYFPKDCFLLILNKLSVKELNIASKVCKLWYQLSLTGTLWRNLAMGDCPPFPKDPTISWKVFYKQNIQGSKIRRLHYDRKGLISAWGKTIGVWKETPAGLRDHYSCTYTDTDHSASINCFFAFKSSVDTNLVTGSADKTLKMWRMRYGEKHFQLLDTLKGHKTPVKVLTGNSSLLFSGSEEGEIRVWRYSYIKPSFDLLETLSAHESAVTALQIDNPRLTRVLFSGSQNGEIKLWKKVGSEYKIGQTLVGYHKGKITALAYNSTRCLLFSGSADKTIRVWKKNVYTLHCVFMVHAHESPVTDILLYKNPEYFLTSAQDGTIKKWEKKENPDPECMFWEREQTFIPARGTSVLSLQPRICSPWSQFEKIYALTSESIIKIAFQEYNRTPQLVKSVCIIPQNPMPNSEEVLEVETSPCEILKDE